MPRRTSSRVQTKKQKEEEEHKQVDEPFKESEDIVEKQKRDLDNSEREHRARQRELKRYRSCSVPFNTTSVTSNISITQP